MAQVLRQRHGWEALSWGLFDDFKQKGELVGSFNEIVLALFHFHGIRLVPLLHFPGAPL